MPNLTITTVIDAINSNNNEALRHSLGDLPPIKFLKQDDYKKIEKNIKYINEDLDNKALRKAIKYDNSEAVKIILANLAAITIEDQNIDELLKLAQTFNRTKIINILETFPKLVKEFYKACDDQNIEKVQEILKERPDYAHDLANIKLVKYDYIHTPLSRAINHSNTKLVEILLNAGSNPNALLDDRAALHKAVKYIKDIKCFEEIAELLIKHRAEIDFYSKSDLYTPISQAANNQDLDKVRFLISKGVDLDIEDSFSPLCWAIRLSNKKMTELLINANININQIDDHSFDYDSLYSLDNEDDNYCNLSQLEIIKQLIASGSELDNFTNAYCGDVVDVLVETYNVIGLKGDPELKRAKLISRTDSTEYDVEKIKAAIYLELQELVDGYQGLKAFYESFQLSASIFLTSRSKSLKVEQNGNEITLPPDIEARITSYKTNNKFENWNGMHVNRAKTLFKNHINLKQINNIELSDEDVKQILKNLKIEGEFPDYFVPNDTSLRYLKAAYIMTCEESKFKEFLEQNSNISQSQKRDREEEKPIIGIHTERAKTNDSSNINSGPSV